MAFVCVFNSKFCFSRRCPLQRYLPFPVFCIRRVTFSPVNETRYVVQSWRTEQKRWERNDKKGTKMSAEYSLEERAVSYGWFDGLSAGWHPPFELWKPPLSNRRAVTSPAVRASCYAAAPAEETPSSGWQTTADSCARRKKEVGMKSTECRKVEQEVAVCQNSRVKSEDVIRVQQQRHSTTVHCWLISGRLSDLSSLSLAKYAT